MLFYSTSKHSMVCLMMRFPIIAFQVMFDFFRGIADTLCGLHCLGGMRFRLNL